MVGGKEERRRELPPHQAPLGGQARAANGVLMDGEGQPDQDIFHSNTARVDRRQLISFLESG